jgi:hypothetical protein
MERDSSGGVLAGVKILGSEGDVSLEDAIPKYVQQYQQQYQHQQHQHQQQTQLAQQLLANALQAEAEIFYSCASRDLSFLRGAHEPYHLGESGDYIMTQVGLMNPFYITQNPLYYYVTQPMHYFITGTAAAVASSSSCFVHRDSRVTRIVDHAAASSSSSSSSSSSGSRSSSSSSSSSGSSSSSSSSSGGSSSSSSSSGGGGCSWHGNGFFYKPSH